MAKQIKYHLGIEVDRLTNSIVNTISGDSFPTDVHPVTKSDLKNTTKKNGWLFNWASELMFSDRLVFKLTIRNNPEIVQGLLSIICLHLPAKHHGIKAIRVSFHSNQKQNLLIITKKCWVQLMLGVTKW